MKLCLDCGKPLSGRVVRGMHARCYDRLWRAGLLDTQQEAQETARALAKAQPWRKPR